MIRPIVLAAVFALAVAGCSRAPGQTARGDDAFGQQVRAYLLKHPEVLEEASAKLNQQRRTQALAAASTAIAGKKAALEADPADYVANPNGKVTVVEFFDYRCPYCKAALPDIKGLIQNNKDIRFVFKEFPILPDSDGKIGVSLRAARAAMAAAAAGKYVQVHDAMMSARPLDDEGIARALKANGIDPAQAVASTAYDKHLKDVHDLALDVGATGTPSFVVGDTLVEGNQMDALTAAIAKARKSAKS
ncbi:MAG: protein-disulfide isomerase [Caulobacteraceae bacterium]|nr:protein-disulfide isomerase [Caulobacteraceae bacterium]